MANWPEDLVAQLEAEGVGVAHTTIFISSKASSPKSSTILPQSAVPQLFIMETGGSGSFRTQNDVGDAYENPSAQILVRGGTYSSARAMLVAAYNALVKVSNQTLNGTWYLDIRGMQKFIDLGPDENNYARIAFNVIGTKRP